MEIEKLNAGQCLDLFKATVQPAKSSGPPQLGGIFLQTLLKSNCLEQHFLKDDSPMRQPLAKVGASQPSDAIFQQQGINLATKCSQELSPSANFLLKDNTDLKESQTVIRDKFIQSVWPYAKQAAQLLGLDPKVLMAQAVLETGWGQFVARDDSGHSSNNLFNIKAANCKANSIEIKTTEYLASGPIKTKASFKTYQSIEQSLDDYVALIKDNNRYEEALANRAVPRRYLDALQQAGYATDPCYANKIMAIFEGNELQQALLRNEILC